MNELQNVQQSRVIPQGLEEIQKEDIIIPRAKLLQALSPEVQEEDMKQGMIINSLTKEILPAEFVPVFLGYNWIKWNLRDANHPDFNPDYEPNAVIYRTTNPQDPIVLEEGKFGKNGEPPKIIKFINFFSLFIGEPMPVIISFAKTSYKTGTRLASLAMFTSEMGRIYTKKYKLTSFLERKDVGTFYVFKVSPSGLADEETIKQAENLYNIYHKKDIVVHEEEIQEEQ